MYSRKRSLEDLPVENTPVWSCEKEGCIGWMRDNFTFESVPTCPLCHSVMVRTERLLPLLTNMNTSMYQKSLKKGAQT